MVVLAVLVVGFGIRMYDLTDQPLDFHPTRQLRGAIIARGMYYQMLPNADPELRRQAINYWNSTGQYEPSVIEKIVAYTYVLMGGEYLWVSRIYTSLFWIIGGLLFLPWRAACWLLPSQAPGGASFRQGRY